MFHCQNNVIREARLVFVNVNEYVWKYKDHKDYWRDEELLYKFICFNNKYNGKKSVINSVFSFPTCK